MSAVGASYRIATFVASTHGPCWDDRRTTVCAPPLNAFITRCNIESEPVNASIMRWNVNALCMRM